MRSRISRLVFTLLLAVGISLSSTEFARVPMASTAPWISLLVALLLVGGGSVIASRGGRHRAALALAGGLAALACSGVCRIDLVRSDTAIHYALAVFGSVLAYEFIGSTLTVLGAILIAALGAAGLHSWGRLAELCWIFELFLVITLILRQFWARAGRMALRLALVSVAVHVGGVWIQKGLFLALYRLAGPR